MPNKLDTKGQVKSSSSNEVEGGLTTEKNIVDSNQVEVKQTPSPIKYQETPYRWFVMIAYCLTVFANGFQWVTFSAIATDFSNNYDVPSWKVNMFSLMYMIIYPFVCIPEGWLIDNYSTRLGIILASATTLLGAGLKMFINKDSSLACCFCWTVFQWLVSASFVKLTRENSCQLVQGRY